MNRDIVWHKDKFIVVRNGGRKAYYTAINTDDQSHTHVSPRKNCHSKDIVETAKFIAQKARLGVIKDKYPYFIKLSIFRIMNKHHQEYHLKMFKEKDIIAYYKGDLDNLTWKDDGRRA